MALSLLAEEEEAEGEEVVGDFVRVLVRSE